MRILPALEFIGCVVANIVMGIDCRSFTDVYQMKPLVEGVFEDSSLQRLGFAM